MTLIFSIRNDTFNKFFKGESKVPQNVLTELWFSNSTLKKLKIVTQIDKCTWIFTVAKVPNSQKVETIQVSTDRWMDKQNVVYTYDWILFSHKNSDIRYNMIGEPWKYYKWNKPDTRVKTYDSTIWGT